MAVNEGPINVKDVRVGDTVRVVEFKEDVEVTYTLQVARIDTTRLVWLYSPEDISVTVDSGMAVYLVSRPETSPEVEAIVKILGVTYDVASYYHSRGIRAVETEN